MKRRKINEPRSFLYRHSGGHAALLSTSMGTGRGATMRGDLTNSCKGDHRDLSCLLDDYISDNLCFISCFETRVSISCSAIFWQLLVSRASFFVSRNFLHSEQFLVFYQL